MTDSLTIGWTGAQAATARTAYHRLLACNLILQTVVGLVAVVVPMGARAHIGSPGAAVARLRLWGIMLLVTASLYLPGCIEPVHVRWPNLVGIAARFVLVLVYIDLGHGFLWFALYELIFAVVLAWSYRRLLRAELMSRP